MQVLINGCIGLQMVPIFEEPKVRKCNDNACSLLVFKRLQHSSLMHKVKSSKGLRDFLQKAGFFQNNCSCKSISYIQTANARIPNFFYKTENDFHGHQIG